MSAERSPPPPSLRNPQTVRRLCVFARAPVLGQVKSRLAAATGEPAALAAHVRLVEHTLMQVGAPHVGAPRAFPGLRDLVRELWIAGDSGGALVRHWSARFDFDLQEQCPGDLGERMRHALGATAGRGRTVLIGSDCPAIDAAYVEAAFEALVEADVVLGPTEDGGYGLIGTWVDVPELFEAMPWSTDRVLAETTARCSRLGLRYALLPRIWDVDTASDWQRFLRQARSIG